MRPAASGKAAEGGQRRAAKDVWETDGPSAEEDGPCQEACGRYGREEAVRVRWIGACLVTAGCTGLGRHMAQQWRLRLRWLEQLRQMIYFLKGEIV